MPKKEKLIENTKWVLEIDLKFSAKDFFYCQVLHSFVRRVKFSRLICGGCFLICSVSITSTPPTTTYNDFRRATWIASSSSTGKNQSINFSLSPIVEWDARSFHLIWLCRSIMKSTVMRRHVDWRLFLVSRMKVNDVMWSMKILWIKFLFSFPASRKWWRLVGSRTSPKPSPESSRATTSVSGRTSEVARTAFS